jgi:hypothetical protein
MKAYWGMEAFLTSALDGCEWSASRPGRFTARERAPGTHCIGGWVGHRYSLNTMVKREILRARLSSGNACYLSVRNHLPSRHFSEIEVLGSGMSRGVLVTFIYDCIVV